MALNWTTAIMDGRTIHQAIAVNSDKNAGPNRECLGDFWIFPNTNDWNYTLWDYCQDEDEPIACDVTLDEAKAIAAVEAGLAEMAGAE